MINMQEQMQGGFANISRQIRALSSSLEPQIDQPRRQIESNRQISQQKQPKREHRRSDKYDDEAEDDQEYIEEMIPEYESDEDQYYYDEAFEQKQEAAQKKFVKEYKMEIKVRFIYFQFIHVDGLLISHFLLSLS
jgi:hypothetical protein